jgi:glycosyltransferase involved in cell wall biosynthesis
LDRVHVIPAYIKEDVQPELLSEAFGIIPQGKVKIVTSGYLTRVYNYEILAESIRRLDPGKFHFIFAFYGKYDKQYEAELMDLLSGYSNITVCRDLSPEAFLAVLASSDVYVRATLRDGDSVAVREALAVGNSVYASDCVRRPPSCIVFRDAQELIEHLRGWPADQQTQRSRTSDGTRQILDLYAALNGDLEHATSSQ